MTDFTPRRFLTSKYGALFIAIALLTLCLCLPTGGHATVDSRLHVGNEHVSFTWTVYGYRGWGSRKIRRRWGRFYGDLSGTLQNHLTSEVPDLTLPRFEFGRPEPPTQFVRKLVSRVKRGDSAAARYLGDNPDWGGLSSPCPSSKLLGNGGFIRPAACFTGVSPRKTSISCRRT
jgi:hypothetical protein